MGVSSICEGAGQCACIACVSILQGICQSAPSPPPHSHSLPLGTGNSQRQFLMPRPNSRQTVAFTAERRMTLKCRRCNINFHNRKYRFVRHVVATVETQPPQRNSHSTTHAPIAILVLQIFPAQCPKAAIELEEISEAIDAQQVTGNS